jgi:hypothetical protein
MIWASAGRSRRPDAAGAGHVRCQRRPSWRAGLNRRRQCNVGELAARRICPKSSALAISGCRAGIQTVDPSARMQRRRGAEDRASQGDAPGLRPWRGCAAAGQLICARSPRNLIWGRRKGRRALGACGSCRVSTAGVLGAYRFRPHSRGNTPAAKCRPPSGRDGKRFAGDRRHVSFNAGMVGQATSGLADQAGEGLGGARSRLQRRNARVCRRARVVHRGVLNRVTQRHTRPTYVIGAAARTGGVRGFRCPSRVHAPRAAPRRVFLPPARG